MGRIGLIGQKRRRGAALHNGLGKLEMEEAGRLA
jgi:hypothetical protein